MLFPSPALPADVECAFGGVFQACHLEDAAERLPFHFSPWIPAPCTSLTVDPWFPVSFVFFLRLLSCFGGGISSTFFLRGRMEDELPCISRAFVLCFCRMGCPGECPCSELFPLVSAGTGSFSCFCCCFREFPRHSAGPWWDHFSSWQL